MGHNLRWCKAMRCTSYSHKTKENWIQSKSADLLTAGAGDVRCWRYASTQRRRSCTLVPPPAMHTQRRQHASIRLFLTYLLRLRTFVYNLYVSTCVDFLKARSTLCFAGSGAMHMDLERGYICAVGMAYDVLHELLKCSWQV